MNLPLFGSIFSPARYIWEGNWDPQRIAILAVAALAIAVSNKVFGRSLIVNSLFGVPYFFRGGVGTKKDYDYERIPSRPNFVDALIVISLIGAEPFKNFISRFLNIKHYLSIDPYWESFFFLLMIALTLALVFCVLMPNALSGYFNRFWLREEDIEATEDTRQVFLYNAIGMLARLAKADGIIEKEEIAFIEKYFSDHLHLDSEQRLNAIRIFNETLHSKQSFDDFARNVAKASNHNVTVLKTFFDVLYGLTNQDGVPSPAEQILLDRSKIIFGIFVTGNAGTSWRKKSYQEYSAPTENDPYKILGCKPNDPTVTIKKAYRRHMLELHPDRLVAKGLPREFIKSAKEKFLKIQKAYETIMEERRD